MTGSDGTGPLVTGRADGPDGAVTVVALARPGRLNALTAPLLTALRNELARIGDDPACRAVVLTGEGTSFCSGMDLDAGITDDSYGDPAQSGLAGLRAGVAAIVALREIRQPVIAAVRGNAVGAGFALAAACDLRIVAPDVRFSAPFVRLGVSAGDLGLSWFLPRIIGGGRAAELFYRAGAVDAQTAVATGLAGEIADDPLARAVEVAGQIAAHPGYGVAATKELLNATWSSSLRDHLASEARAQVLGLLTDDHRAALDALRSALSQRPG
jgi:enoyl-CoA hydratase/carnithine racemase